MSEQTIQTLPLDVINLIAAGEVIDSLGAVVRELAENSLDAGATRIVISFWPEVWRVQVADNGQGMSLADLRICTMPHTTSKIYSSEDLWEITSLGFRGEALHSLTQVARVEIFSRLVTEDMGWRVVYQQENLLSEEMIAFAPGTIVNISHLFDKLPVRRNALPSPCQQLKTAQKIIYDLALCHPQVTWQVWHERNWFNLSQGKNSAEILAQLLKQINLGDLQTLNFEVEIPEQNQSCQLEIVIGLPDRLHRHRPDWVKIAINGRMVHCPSLEQTIFQSFARTLPKERYPVCFIHLHLPANQIDWNRHPAKKEIYLHSMSFWQEKIALGIEQALKINSGNLSDSFHNLRVQKLLKVAEEKSSYNVNFSEAKEQKTSEINLMILTAIAQLRNTYIVAEHSTGLWLIEQHIAHERILYEQLQDDWRLISLETPIILNNLTDEQVEQLTNIGLEIEPFGEQLSAVRTIPEMLYKRKDFEDALLELSWGGNLQTAQVAVACRSAIRNGTPLDLATMQNLLDGWKNTRNPRTCPHGRPIYLSLEESALARFFKRHWVVGKSHGI